MATQDRIKRSKKKQKRKDYTPFIIIGVLAVVVILVVILTTLNSVNQEKQATPIPAVTSEIIDPTFHSVQPVDGLSMGDPNAPVKVIEFADFQCPGCAGYWLQMEPSIIEAYVKTGKIYYTFSPFSFLGAYGSNPDWDESRKAAQAAYCANDQAKFWEMRDYLFANHDGENQGAFARERILAMAERLSLDMTTFTECLDSGKYESTVDEANQFAQESGVTFTPSFSVNGTVVSTADFVTTMDEALK